MVIIIEIYFVVFKYREDMGVYIRLVDYYFYGRVRFGGWIISLYKY